MTGVEDLQPGTSGWRRGSRGPALNGIAMSFLPHTMSVGTDSSPARSRRSCSGVAKLRHSAARGPDALGRFRHRGRALDDQPVAGRSWPSCSRGRTGERPGGTPPACRAPGKSCGRSGFNGTNPPVLTRIRPATHSGRLIASRAAANPPTEFPINTARDRPRPSTTSSSTSAKSGALGSMGGVNRIGIAVPGPVHRDDAVAPRQRLDDRVEVMPVMQRRMQQQNRWTTTGFVIGNAPRPGLNSRHGSSSRRS